MERHHSTGVATIVALMAAHRAASGREGAAAAYGQEEVASIEKYLREEHPAAPPWWEVTLRGLPSALTPNVGRVR